MPVLQKGPLRAAGSLGSFEVDQKLELCRLLDRQVGRLGPLEDAINIRCRTEVKVSQINSVGNEAAGNYEVICHDRSDWLLAALVLNGLARSLPQSVP